jgi:hypothetical protein
LIGATFLVLAVLMGASGAIHFLNGRAVDAAYPVQLDLSVGIGLPRAAYVDAVEALGRADTGDGISTLYLAQSRFRSGTKPESVLGQARNGLSLAPASVEGWVFYAEMLEQIDSKGAASALSQAFTLGPYDFFLAERRARLASRLWVYLSADTKRDTLRQVRLLWSEVGLRDAMVSLLSTSDGEKLFTRAYENDFDTVRTINRWASARRRQMQPQKP